MRAEKGKKGILANEKVVKSERSNRNRCRLCASCMEVSRGRTARDDQMQVRRAQVAAVPPIVATRHSLELQFISLRCLFILGTLSATTLGRTCQRISFEI